MEDEYESDESNEENEEIPHFKPQHVVYAIDTDPSMFIKGEDGEMPFKNCLKALHNIAVSCLLFTPRSMKSPLGVFLAKNELEQAQLISFRQSMPENVKLLGSLCNKVKKELQKLYEHVEDFDFADFLLLCKHQMDQLKVDTFKSTIVYLTNLSDPTNGDKLLRDKVYRSVNNLQQQNVHLKIITMNPAFDMDVFYKELFGKLNFKPIEYVQSWEDLEELLASYLQRKTTKNSFNFYPFPGKWNKYFKINAVSYIKDNHIKNNMTVTKNDHTQVKKIYQKDSRIPSEITIKNTDEKESTFGVSMKITEAGALFKTNVPQGFTLLYTCKKISNPYWILKPITILQGHPDEQNKYFQNFWKSVAKSNLVMVCYFKFRDYGRVHYVELEPKLIDNVESFLCKILPNTEDIIDIPEIVPTDIPEEAEEAMRSIVKKLTFDYSPKLFNNLSYVEKEEFIRSQLLEEPFPLKEKVENDMEKANEKIEKLIAEEAAILTNLFEEPKKGIKRKE